MVAQFEKLKRIGLIGKRCSAKFIDQRGNFLTREEAWIVAEKANQIIRREWVQMVLSFCENLY